MTTAVPILRVVDVDASLAWWSRLGFTEGFRHQFEGTTPRFMSIIRDDCTVFLSEHTGDAHHPGLIYLWVDDVDTLAAEFGATIDVMPWARDFEVADPDGNRVRVATSVQAPPG